MAMTTSPGPGVGSGNSRSSSFRSPRNTTPRMGPSWLVRYSNAPRAAHRRRFTLKEAADPMSEAIHRARPTAVKINVVDNQIEHALKQLKKEMVSSGVFKEMKRRAYYEKPS